MEVSLTQIFRPPPARAGVLRRNHPRQSGSGAAGQRAVGLRPRGDQEDAWRVPDRRNSGRRASQPAHQLQELRFEQYFKQGRGCRTEGTFRSPNDFGVNKGLSNLPYLQKPGRQINRRLLEVQRFSHNSGLSGDSVQRVVQPTVTEDGEKAPALKFGQPRVMALFLALTLFQHLIDGFKGLMFSHRAPTAISSPRTAGKSPGCSRASKPAYSGPPSPCSPATTPSYRSRCADPSTASITSLMS